MNLRPLSLAILLALSLPASAVNITFVYQDPADPFFTPQARAALDKAAADVSSAITTTLAPLSQDVYTGTSGPTTASVNWALNYRDPTANSSTTITLDTFDLTLNEVRIYVGSTSLGGTTLGVGGTGGVGLQINQNNTTQLAGAFANLTVSSNAGMVRGGPVLGTLAGTVSGEPISLNYGYGISSLTIDSAAAWNFDYTATSFSGLSDLYSVGVHEILHSLGFGVGSTWFANVANDTDWNGTAVHGLLGTGLNVLDETGAHIAEGLAGRPLIDGVLQSYQQEALMDPTLTEGTRKYITTLDLAFLQDMGWSVVAVPEPSTGLLLFGGALVLRFVRRRTLA